MLHDPCYLDTIESVKVAHMTSNKSIAQLKRLIVFHNEDDDPEQAQYYQDMLDRRRYNSRNSVKAYRTRLTPEQKEKRLAATRIWAQNNKEHTNAYKVRKARENKVKAIALLGDCCDECKKQFHPAAMDFHHLDPNTKNHELNAPMMSRKWESIVREISKCRLLCSNCHRTLHAIGANGTETILEVK